MTRAFLLVAMLALGASATQAAGLSVVLAPAPGNAAVPRMGDHLTFVTDIRNDGAVPIEGLVGWISLVQIDAGHEQPIDLEDWSAHKAIVQPSLSPGESLRTEWPMRLIQPGQYRVAVSAASRTDTTLSASNFAAFTVGSKPVVESARVLPVALGLPLLLAGALLVQWRRSRSP